MFTDGSGGMHSSDKRLRRCALARVCPQIGSNRTVRHRPSLGRDFKDRKTIKYITIHSGCEMVVNSFAKWKSYSQLTACGGIWADIWAMVDQRESRWIKDRIHKIKAHTEDENLAPLALRFGN